MNMKKLLFAFAAGHLFTLPTVMLAQDDFYYVCNNEKVFLTEVSGKYVIEFPDGLNSEVQAEILPGEDGYPKKINDKIYVVTDTNDLNSYSSDYYITPMYTTSEGAELYVTRSILLKFKSDVSDSAKDNIESTYSLVNVKTTSIYEMYTCSDALQTSRVVYESGLVEFCHPDFISQVEPHHIPNDEYFGKQFYLHNTGQIINDGRSGTLDADIDAPEAWDITKGSSDIVIAVIDEGVTSNHPDLPNTRQVRLNGSNFGGGDPDDPSPVDSLEKTTNHGNACAGIIAATQDDSIGISGVAPLCKIMPVRIDYGISTLSDFADAIEFAYKNGANVISNSWGGGTESLCVIVRAIENAIDSGSIVIFSAGNKAHHMNGYPGYVVFPGNANIEDLITVGASDRNNQQANYSPTGTEFEIAAPSHRASCWPQDSTETSEVWTIDIPGIYGNNPWKDYLDDPRYNPCDDIPPHGERLPSTGSNPLAYTGRMGGTSAAAPQVAGVAALMLSVNSCLVPHQIKDLLQKTADKVGGYNYYWNPDAFGHSKELGYGKLNAHKAVVAAQSFHSTTLDLYMRDRHDDLGYDAGYAWTWGFDKSPDIWVRNQNDGLTNHQSQAAEYSSSSPVYVYVRVGNKSCVASTGTEKLSLYWTKASSNSSWPQNWDGTDTTIGNKISTSNIPALQPGQHTILELTWNTPDPYIHKKWEFCLLARIEGVAADPIRVHPNELAQDIYQNNNVSMRNVAIIDWVLSIDDPDLPYYPPGSFVYVGSSRDEEVNADGEGTEEGTYDLILRVPESVDGSPLTEEAEVSLRFDKQGWEIFESQLHDREDVRIRGEGEIIISGANMVSFNNLNFPANTRIPIYIGFSFLIDRVSEKSEFEYHLIQKHSTARIEVEEHWTGGVHFRVKKYPREPFAAIATVSDWEINRGESVTIVAEQLAEAAIYNWYDSEDNLISTGESITVSPELTHTYKLEVIALADGFKDYSEDLEITVNSNRRLTALYPNPVESLVVINYLVEDVSSAYLILSGVSSVDIGEIYPLEVDNTVFTINTADYETGVYTVALVCDDEIVDVMELVIE